METAIAGACAGLVSRLAIAPFDVVKIRMQLQSQPRAGLSEQVVVTLPHLVRQIYHTEGLAGFFKGNAAASAMYVLYGATQFTTYTWLRNHLLALPAARKVPRLVDFGTGAAAGIAATVVSYPFDLFRTRFAAQHIRRKVYRSMREAISDVYTREGLRGFYRGSLNAAIQVAPYMGFMFMTFETSMSLLREWQVPEGRAAFVAGLASGTVSKALVFPLDTVRRRLQVQGPRRNEYIVKHIPVYRNSFDAMTSIARVEGVRRLYYGLGVSLVKSAPNAAITLWAFDECKRLLQRLKSTLPD